MSNWHYLKDGKQTGPVSFETLRQLAQNGELSGPDSLVWSEGMPEWTSPDNIPGLSQIATSEASNDSNSENPYAPPSTVAYQPTLRSGPEVDIEPGSSKLEIERIVSHSWKLAKANLLKILGVGILYLIIAALIGYGAESLFPTEANSVPSSVQDYVNLTLQAYDPELLY